MVFPLYIKAQTTTIFRAVNCDRNILGENPEIRPAHEIKLGKCRNFQIALNYLNVIIPVIIKNINITIE